jgi:hypothetical protein
LPVRRDNLTVIAHLLSQNYGRLEVEIERKNLLFTDILALLRLVMGEGEEYLQNII